MSVVEGHVLLLRADNTQGRSELLKTIAQDLSCLHFTYNSVLSPKILGEKRDCRAGNHVLISISLLHLSDGADH